MIQTSTKKNLNENSNFNYSFGFSMPESDYCDFVSNFTNLNIDVLLLHYIQNGELSSRESLLSCEPYNVTKNLKNPVNLITSLDVTFMLHEREFTFERINMTRLVTNWRHFLNLPSDICMIAPAFDIYNKYTKYLSNGWWYLLKDPGNANTNKYVFEEKFAIASRVDFEENPKNFQWLEQNHEFDENITGIVLLRKGSPYSPEFIHFCRIMLINEHIWDQFELN